ncbi:prorelaxin H2 [Marmota marmota marmota]|uniref:prorelaxin H2 n=1 Tax=Marmota marmota marmota TaxID=9994 RepID=UPI0007627600|nr:prorelaxin H2 [Marmota marmota marmota]
MSHLFLVHLLGIWLLLSQVSTAPQPGWWEEVVQMCGRQLVREVINICGHATWNRPVRYPHRRSADIMPSSLNEDAGAFNMMLGFSPNLPQQLRATPSERLPLSLELQRQEPAIEDSKPSPEELKDIIHNRQGEAENSLSKLEYLSLNTHSRKKRRINEDSLTEKCCQRKCTRRFMLKFC